MPTDPRHPIADDQRDRMMSVPDYAGGVLVRDGRILLGLRSAAKSTAPACWDVIGGRLEYGETHEQACLRELEEEIGVRAAIDGELMRARLSSGSDYRIFRIVSWHGEPRVANDEHTRLAWVTPGEACRLAPLASPRYLELFAILEAGA